MSVRKVAGLQGNHKEQRMDGSLVQIKAPWQLVLAVCILVPACIAGGGAGGFWLGKQRRPHMTPAEVHSSAIQNSGNPSADSRRTEMQEAEGAGASSGPWGNLECHNILIEVPQECLAGERRDWPQPDW